MLLVDTHEKSVIQDVQLKKQIAQSRPHSIWLKEKVIYFIFTKFKCISGYILLKVQKLMVLI